MKRLKITGAIANGYTIIETLVVFAASSVLVLTVIATISGQQGKTEFAQAIRDADSRIQDTLNDYASGFYERGSNVSCTADNSGNPPVLTNAPSNIGTNIGCAYIGRLIKFSGADSYTVHTVVGRQFQAGVFSPEVSNLIQARPRLIYPTTTNPTIPNLSRSDLFNGKVNVARVVYVDSISGTEEEIGAFAVTTSFSAYTGGSLSTDKQNPQLVAIKNTLHTMSQSNTQLADAIAAPPSPGYVVGRPIAICFESTKSNQHAIIRIADNQGRLTTSIIIGAGNTCPVDLIP